MRAADPYVLLIVRTLHNSTRVDEGGKKMLLICFAIKMKARTVVGRGEEGALCDPGSELPLGGRARAAVRGD